MRSAVVHAVTAFGLGAIGAGAALSRPALTAAALTTLFLAGALVSLAPRVRIAPAAADAVSGWAAGGAAFALPGAVAAFVAATVPTDPTPTPASLREVTVPVLAAASSPSASPSATRRSARWRAADQPAADAWAPGWARWRRRGRVRRARHHRADAWVGALLLVAAVLLFLAPSIDAGPPRRPAARTAPTWPPRRPPRPDRHAGPDRGGPGARCAARGRRGRAWSWWWRSASRAMPGGVAARPGPRHARSAGTLIGADRRLDRAARRGRCTGHPGPDLGGRPDRWPAAPTGGRPGRRRSRW